MTFRAARGPSGPHRRWAPMMTVLAVVAAVLFTAPGPVSAAGGRNFTARPLTAASHTSGPKAASSRLAESDPSLMRGGTGTVKIVVKLDYDSAASYRGGVKGLAPTSPSATGREYNPSSPEGRAHDRYAASKEASFESRLRQVSPGSKVGRRLRTVYGGVALTAPAADVPRIAAIAGVTAVQRDALNQPLTDSSPEFIGAPTLYGQLASTDRDAGRGVIVGILDTGAWPEHPSFRNNQNLVSPPKRADGQKRVCDFGDNPVTPANDVYQCNKKLISGEPFLDTYNAFGGPETYPDSARDGNGHGTHTASTSAGSYVTDAKIFGIQRGPIHGIAPGAYVAAYKVCGTEGCFSTDSAAAVGRAIEDGVKVINFSISGGSNPLTDVVELAFLDAYQAGVFVAASAGNSGPGAATSDHLGPWVTTVAASTQKRAFQSTLTLRSSSTSLNLVGASITNGVPAAPVVKAETTPGYMDKLCTTPAPDGLFAGKIVVCQRGVNGRAEKGFNVLQGDAVGMILYNATTQDTETDNHWLPTIHLEGPQGAQLLAFLAAHPSTTGSFTTGQKATAQGDVMAAFSSRGPGGVSIKPDITAPGVQILAGHTPTPDEVAGGPPGQYFQAIAGTSMSSPHIAGSAALVAALHPDWSPGQVKSALMTTATTRVVKEDTVTPADPFDFGAGRVDLTKAGDPGLTFSDTALRMLALTADPIHAVDINLPSVNAPVMPGSITTQRVARNTTGSPMTFNVATKAPFGGRIAVVPSNFTVRPGNSVTLNITIDGARLVPGQYFGRIDLNQVSGSRRLHLPVAFNRQQGSVSLASACVPPSIKVGGPTSTCTVTARNNSFGNTAVSTRSSVSTNLDVTGVTGARRVDTRTVETGPTDLAGKTPAVPAIGPGSTPAGGYLDLEDIGSEPSPVGDEDFLTFDGLPPYSYGGETYTSVGISSNGYLVAGGGSNEDNTYEPQDLPDPARPNNVLAAFWTDLNGDGAEGLRAEILSDDETGEAWLVVQYDVFLYGTDDAVATQVWIGLNGTEDISYAYGGPQPDPGPAGLTVGAENIDGSAGAEVSDEQALSGEPLRVTTSGAAPGGSLSYTITVKGNQVGRGTVTTSMTSPSVPGTTVETARVTITS